MMLTIACKVSPLAVETGAGHMLLASLASAQRHRSRARGASGRLIRRARHVQVHAADMRLRVRVHRSGRTDDSVLTERLLAPWVRRATGMRERGGMQARWRRSTVRAVRRKVTLRCHGATVERRQPCGAEGCLVGRTLEARQRLGQRWSTVLASRAFGDRQPVRRARRGRRIQVVGRRCTLWRHVLEEGRALGPAAKRWQAAETQRRELRSRSVVC
jgi:hypothetical protein